MPQEPWEVYQAQDKKEPWEIYRDQGEAPAAKRTMGQSLKGAGVQAGYGLAQGAVALPNLIYRGIDLAGEKLTGRDFLPNIEESPTYKALFEEKPEAEDALGRYAHRVGEFAGGSILPGAGIFGLSRALPTTLGFRTLGRMSGKSIAELEALGAGTGALGAQTAEEMGGGPWVQAGAGILGGVAGPMALGPGITALQRGMAGA